MAIEEAFFPFYFLGSTQRWWHFWRFSFHKILPFFRSAKHITAVILSTQVIQPRAELATTDQVNRSTALTKLTMEFALIFESCSSQRNVLFCSYLPHAFVFTLPDSSISYDEEKRDPLNFSLSFRRFERKFRKQPLLLKRTVFFRISGSAVCPAFRIRIVQEYWRSTV